MRQLTKDRPQCILASILCMGEKCCVLAANNCWDSQITVISMTRTVWAARPRPPGSTPISKTVLPTRKVYGPAASTNLGVFNKPEVKVLERKAV
ncbi:hypothetical protein [Neomoorella humiferrea]|uniref:hypothetical protein n=1 Tax=Neomoorella humiferrea TaxID=676965 RepID=UPI0011B2092C|nr:hypothetical protein [Moorella humiferrea]